MTPIEIVGIILIVIALIALFNYIISRVSEKKITPMDYQGYPINNPYNIYEVPKSITQIVNETNEKEKSDSICNIVSGLKQAAITKEKIQLNQKITKDKEKEIYDEIEDKISKLSNKERKELQAFIDKFKNNKK